MNSAASDIPSWHTHVTLVWAAWAIPSLSARLAAKEFAHAWDTANTRSHMADELPPGAVHGAVEPPCVATVEVMHGIALDEYAIEWFHGPHAGDYGDSQSAPLRVENKAWFRGLTSLCDLSTSTLLPTWIFSAAQGTCDTLLQRMEEPVHAAHSAATTSSPTDVGRPGTSLGTARDENVWGRREHSQRPEHIAAGVQKSEDNPQSTLLQDAAPERAPSLELPVAPLGFHCVVLPGARPKFEVKNAFSEFYAGLSS